MPVWSDAAYADACRVGTWADAAPSSIQLDEWVRNWIPGLTQDRRRVAVFPVGDGDRGIAVDPNRLHLDLLRESERYE